MNSEEKILDLPEKNDEAPAKFENRAWRDLLIVVGVLLSLLGIAFLVLNIMDLYKTIEMLARNDFYSSYFSWGSWLLGKSLSILYIICFLVGGIGLILRKISGWIFSLAVAVFAIITIAILVLQFMFSFDGKLGNFGWALFGIVIFFGLIVFLLLSKPIRNYFRPTRRVLGIVGIIILIFAIDFGLLWLFR